MPCGTAIDDAFATDDDAEQQRAHRYAEILAQCERQRHHQHDRPVERHRARQRDAEQAREDVHDRRAPASAPRQQRGRAPREPRSLDEPRERQRRREEREQRRDRPHGRPDARPGEQVARGEDAENGGGASAARARGQQGDRCCCENPA